MTKACPQATLYFCTMCTAKLLAKWRLRGDAALTKIAALGSHTTAEAKCLLLLQMSKACQCNDGGPEADPEPWC